MGTKGSKGNKSVKLIGAFKLAKGILLLALAFGAVGYLRGDWHDRVLRLIQQLSVDPGSKYFHAFATKLLNLSPKLPLIVAGTALYGGLFSVEGIGLLLEKRWAEYLTVIATGSFLPLEVYEIVKHASPMKIGVLILNVAIVAYLIVRLKKDKA